MSELRFSVFLVDDESRNLRTLTRILQANGYSVFAFASARQFLAEHDHTLPGCAVVDFEMPEIDGLQLMQRLASSESDRPVIFLSDVNDAPAAVRAMKAGAIDFLLNPISPSNLLLAVQAASERDVRLRFRRSEETLVHGRLSRLTCRETEVMRHVIAGLPNKLIANMLGVATRTVKLHRGRIMQKTGLRTVADLVRMTEFAGIQPVFADRRIATPAILSSTPALLADRTGKTGKTGMLHVNGLN